VAVDKSAIINSIISNCFDKSPEVIETLYHKLVAEKRRIDNELDAESFVANPISTLNYNFMIHSASQFKRKDFLMQLLFETTVTDIRVDLQSYIRAKQMVFHLLPTQSEKLINREVHEMAYYLEQIS
jgi:hypothetical protein